MGRCQHQVSDRELHSTSHKIRTDKSIQRRWHKVWHTFFIKMQSLLQFCDNSNIDSHRCLLINSRCQNLSKGNRSLYNKHSRRIIEFKWSQLTRHSRWNKKLKSIRNRKLMHFKYLSTSNRWGAGLIYKILRNRL